MDAVLLVDRDGQTVVYGAAAGRPFQSIEDAEEVISLNGHYFGGAPVTAVEIQPHGLAHAASDETHDSAGATGVPGLLAQGAISGSPDGTLRDPSKRSLLALLIDGERNVYGTAEGADHSAFGELARAQDAITANEAQHLTAVEVQPFDDLVTE